MDSGRYLFSYFVMVPEFSHGTQELKLKEKNCIAKKLERRFIYGLRAGYKIGSEG